MFFSWESSKSRHIRIPVVIFDPGRDEQSEYELGTMPMFLPSELLLDTTCAGTCLHCVCVCTENIGAQCVRFGSIFAYDQKLFQQRFLGDDEHALWCNWTC